MDFLPKKLAKNFFLITTISSVVFFNTYRFSKSNPESDLLNKGTKPIFQKDNNGRFIHCNNFINYNLCLEDHQKRGGELIVWFGNSQLHAINQYLDGQNSAPLILHNKLLNNKKDLITFSYGNANLQEHLIQYSWIRKQIKPKIIILSLFFDDTREGSLREDLVNILSKDINNKIISNSELDYSDFIESNSTEKIEIKDNLTPQAKLEKYLNRNLGNFSYFWRNKSEIAYKYFVYLNKLKNTVFNITPETKRALIKPIYIRNLEALKAIVKIANEDKTKVYLYIPPINYKYDLPYFESQYKDFKATVRKISQESKLIFFEDLDNIIPDNYWGLKDSTTVSNKLEIDFMHFTAKAHKVLANYIYEKLLEIDKK